VGTVKRNFVRLVPGDRVEWSWRLTIRGGQDYEKDWAGQ